MRFGLFAGTAILALTVLAKPSPAPGPAQLASSPLLSGSSANAVASAPYVSVRNRVRVTCTVTVEIKGAVPPATPEPYPLLANLAVQTAVLGPSQALNVGIPNPNLLPAGATYWASVTSSCLGDDDVQGTFGLIERDSGRVLVALAFRRVK